MSLGKPVAERGNLDYLPIWKKGATPEERFLELAVMARVRPERFKRVFVAYQEDVEQPAGDISPRICTRYASNGMNTTECLGVIELAKLEILRHTHDF